MATLTTEQIEQKKQLLEEKVKQMKAIYDELVEAGAIEMSDEELDGVAGGGAFLDAMTKVGDWLGEKVFTPFSEGIEAIGSWLSK